MFRTIEDFLGEWKEETAATHKIFQTLTDESLGQKVYGEGRTLARLAQHITESLFSMSQQSGLKLSLPTSEGQPVSSAAMLVELYDRSASSVADGVQSQWTDAMLAEEVPMYGEKWKRGKVLSALICHQTHHRAQMTILMRQAGLHVPGVYGPAKEEWKAYGFEPQV